MSYPDYPLVNELNKMLDKADTFKELDNALSFYEYLKEKYGKITGHYGNKLSDGKMDCNFGKRVVEKNAKVYEKLEYMRMVLDGTEQEDGTIRWTDNSFKERLRELDSDCELLSDEEAGTGAGAGEGKFNKGGRRRRRKSKKRKNKKKKKTRRKRKKRKTRKKRKLRKKKRRKTNRK